MTGDFPVSKILLVVRGLVENPDGELLLLKRNKNRSYNPLKWELPGGKVLHKETLDHAIERIINQETGLYVANIGQKHYLHNRYVTEPGKYQGFNYFEFTFPSNYIAGTPRISLEEHLEFVWINKTKSLDYDLSLESRKSITQYLGDDSASRSLADVSKAVIVSRALIVDPLGRVLLLKRSQDLLYGGLWEIPGGKLSSFESIEEHLTREILEETGLVIEITSPSSYVHSFIPKKGHYQGVTFINLVSTAVVKSGKVRLSSEHTDYCWRRKDKIFDLDLVEYVKLPLTEILEGNSG